ncbi:MAG TPA: hypothetical protein GXX18_11515 [Bacillales bacterium]|nr:hypothetical protein [Bacillales bacterium]
MNQQKVNCFKCNYFYTTWDVRFPRGCKAYGFKSRQIPSDYVLQVSGHTCMKYEAKNNTPQRQIKRIDDYNRGYRI